MNYSTGGKGGRGAGIAWNVRAPRKLVPPFPAFASAVAHVC